VFMLRTGRSFWKWTFAAAVLPGTISLTRVAVAGADDYAFEPVKEELKASNVATIAVRLVHKPTGKPVPGAVIVQTRVDMSPDGMADMIPVIVPQPSREPGVYVFRSPLTMSGRWLLSITARVPGESEAVAGKVIFRVVP
jgi:YtkA-like